MNSNHSTDRFELAGQAVSAVLDGEVIALDPARGICFGLNAIGSRIWQLVEQPRTVSEICGILIREYDVEEPTCQYEVLDLLTQLVAEGLVISRPGETADSP